jgi:hypothetical protein
MKTEDILNAKETRIIFAGILLGVLASVWIQFLFRLLTSNPVSDIFGFVLSTIFFWGIVVMVLKKINPNKIEADSSPRIIDPIINKPRLEKLDEEDLTSREQRLSGALIVELRVLNRRIKNYNEMAGRFNLNLIFLTLTLLFIGIIQVYYLGISLNQPYFGILLILIFAMVMAFLIAIWWWSRYKKLEKS